MAIELGGREQEISVGLVRPGVRLGTRSIVVLAGLAAGILIGWLAYVMVGGNDTAGVAARAREIQQARAEAMVQAYEVDWAELQPSTTRIAVTGTGPGLAWVADRQVEWSSHAVTGTGPGLVTIAEMQAGTQQTQTPTGTGPGLEHLPGRLGPEVAVIGTP